MSHSRYYAAAGAYVALIFLLSGCEPEHMSGQGLVLPPGTVESGKASFVDLNCIQCHSVVGADIPEHEGESEPLMLLGGKVRKVKTYGELVTAIINPTHSIAPAYREKVQSNENDGQVSTPMPSFNDEMTVSQLIDLVTFLDAQYERMLPDYISRHHSYGAY